jgi:hypothetical protein
MALIGHWPLNGNTNDLSGRSITGTASNLSYAAGKIGQAGSFNGSTTTVTVGNGNTYFPAQLITIGAWIKTSGLGSGQSLNGIFSITYGLSIYLNGSGQLITLADNGSTLTTLTYTGANLADDKWHHVMAVYTSSNRKLYVDGVLVATQSFGWLGTTRWLTNAAVIGQENNNGPVYRFNGLISDVRVYNHALSDLEVKELSKAKVTHLTLNGTAVDSAGYGYNGTPQASVSYTTDTKLYSEAFQNTDAGGSKSITIANGTQNITGDQTIAMWLYPTSFAARRNPWNKAYGGEGTITQETNGALNYYWGTNGGNNTPYQGFTSGTLTINTWNHIALVRDLSASTPQLRWYINGVLSTTATPSYTAATATTTDTTIGSGYAGTYHGRISDVRQYGTALSADDIKALYERRASFDNGGNISVGEYVEIENNATMGVNSKGQVLYEDLSNVGIADSNLIGFWPLDGNTGDYSVNGYDGTPTNVTVTTGRGRYQAYLFTGESSSRIYTATGSNLLNLSGTAQYTAMAWIYPELGGTTWHGVFSKGNSQQWALTLNSPNGYLHYETNQGGVGALNTSNGTIVANTWYHVAIRFNGTNKQIFIDGSSAATQTATALNSASNTEEVRIGEGNNGELFKGKIMFVKVFSRALTDQEIKIESEMFGNNRIKIHKDGEAFIQGNLYEGL